MSTYAYRERERDRDYDSRNVTIKRYVIPSEDREERREFMMTRDDDYGNHELITRRKTERDEPFTISRYERDVEYDMPVRRYERETIERESTDSQASSSSLAPSHHRPRLVEDPPGRLYGQHLRPPSPIHQLTPRHHPARYVSPRHSEFEVDEEYYHRRVDDRHSRRDVSPGDSVSQASRRRGRTDYGSDDEYYYHEETRTYDDDHPHRRRHLAEGALVGAGAAELFRSHRKREGDEVSHGMNHAMKTAGAGALGAVAVNAASHVRDYYRSKSRSRHRARSFDDERSYRHSHHSHGRRSRSRSRSHSHSRAKTLMEVGLGAAAIAAGVAALRSKKTSDEQRPSRSRTRSRSRARSSTRTTEKDSAKSVSDRNKHIAGAGLAGAAVAGLVEHHRSKSRSRKGERSHSRLRQALPVLAAGLGTAAATGIWEKRKAEKEGKESKSRGTSRSGRSRSRGAPDAAYPDPTRDSAGLIEYGRDPVTGSIPAEHYYGAPAGADVAYYSDEGQYNGRRSRSRSRSRGVRDNDSSSGSESRRRHRKHRSRSRDIAGAALGAGGLGYVAHKYSQSRERKKAEQEDDRARHNHGPHNDPYEDNYDPSPYPPSSGNPKYQEPPVNYYPNTNQFPPPPSTTNLNATPSPNPHGYNNPNSYNPADYPHPPGAAPQSQEQPYNYGAPGPGTEQYAPRPRRADDNVSALSGSTLPTDHHTDDALSRQLAKSKSVQRSSSHSPPPSSKSVSFNLDSEDNQLEDRGYETDDSQSIISNGRHSHRHRLQRRRSSSVPYSPVSDSASASASFTHPRGHRHRHKHHSHHNSSARQNYYKKPEQDSSNSTIELPERFDRHGHRLLKEKEDDPATAKIEDFINRVAKVLF
ncbi:hypothetical protein N7466_009302 [Penicillium verhagenii]|uniref:uncharacterized protein n=1 Tax=Penicillium verhagenii TaxID=1562060 RepID=UPI0025451975|nr:uncharacterized protein N7466_009302 [Penicillium verhagenii]KAJ5920976.1 hypothetical protein N7466_009302 [Penicillium verhagenii]